MRPASVILWLLFGVAGMALADPPLDRERRAHPVPDPKPETEAIPKEYAGEKQVAIKLEKIDQQQAILGMQLTLRIINPTDQEVSYMGFYASSPKIKRQRWVDGKWQDAKEPDGALIKPGISMRAITLPPGQSVVFVMGVTAEHLPSRVGLDYTVANKAPFTVWSDKIER